MEDCSADQQSRKLDFHGLSLIEECQQDQMRLILNKHDLGDWRREWPCRWGRVVPHYQQRSASEDTVNTRFFVWSGANVALSMFLTHCQTVRYQQHNGQLLWSVSVMAVNLTLAFQRVPHYSNQSSTGSRLILIFDEGLDPWSAAAVEDVGDDRSQPIRYKSSFLSIPFEFASFLLIP